MGDFIEYRTFELYRRRTQWWGRYRWDCWTMPENKSLGWTYRKKEWAADHMAILVSFEDVIAESEKQYRRYDR